MIVIDASSLLKYLLYEDGWESVERNMEEGCVAPDIVVAEVASGLLLAYRRGLLSENGFSECLETLERMVGELIVIKPSAAYLEKAVELAVKLKISVYDALYIEMARSSNLPLLTSDEEMLNAAKSLGIEVRYIK